MNASSLSGLWAREIFMRSWAPGGAARSRARSSGAHSARGRVTSATRGPSRRAGERATRVQDGRRRLAALGRGRLTTTASARAMSAAEVGFQRSGEQERVRPRTGAGRAAPGSTIVEPSITTVSLRRMRARTAAQAASTAIGFAIAQTTRARSRRRRAAPCPSRSAAGSPDPRRCGTARRCRRRRKGSRAGSARTTSSVVVNFTATAVPPGDGPKQAHRQGRLAGAARRSGNGRRSPAILASKPSGPERAAGAAPARFWKATAPRISAAPAHCRGPSRSPSRIRTARAMVTTHLERAQHRGAAPDRRGRGPARNVAEGDDRRDHRDRDQHQPGPRVEAECPGRRGQGPRRRTRRRWPGPGARRRRQRRGRRPRTGC